MSKQPERTKAGMDANRAMKFREIALMELKRAERYRNFLSLLVLNLSEFLGTAGRRKINSPEDIREFVDAAASRIKSGARETDTVSILDEDRLVMLLPETDRNGAETAACRFSELLGEYIAEFLECDYQFDVQLEVSSFPNATNDISMKSRLAGLFSEN